MAKRRGNHVGFKMNNYLYVAGGRSRDTGTLECSEKYDIKEEKWIEHPNKLPFGLIGDVVSNSRDDSFVVIIMGGINANCSSNRDIITFNNQDGFKVLNSVSTIFERYRGVSISL